MCQTISDAVRVPAAALGPRLRVARIDRAGPRRQLLRELSLLSWPRYEADHGDVSQYRPTVSVTKAGTEPSLSMYRCQRQSPARCASAS